MIMIVHADYSSMLQLSMACTRGFIELDMLRRRAEKIPGGGTSNQGLDEEFRLLPNESFSCSGTMTGLLLVGTLGRTSGKRNHDQYPEIQIWRNTGGNTYTRQASQEIRLAEGDYFSPDGVLQYNLTHSHIVPEWRCVRSVPT